ncbi:MAG: YcaO-like family protein [Rubrivivax sp.]|nr:YcaO-like family protein [Rubrivivax sp.]
MAGLGISRVTDITRLDRLGLSVHASVRPRGRSLCVHAGKGMRPEESRVGALMEAVELALAELDGERPPDGHFEWAAMQSIWPVGIQPIQFAPQAGFSFDPNRVWPVVWGDWIDTGSGRVRQVPIPDELMRWPLPGRTGPSAFPWSSNGLASGNSLQEATLHAALELLERDTLALERVLRRWRRVVHLPASALAWQRRWAEVGVELVVRQLPNEFGLPCFSAVLIDETSADVNLAEGSGLHLDRGIALARAVSEAAQSRLSTLHGGRDDIVHFYAKYESVPVADRLQAEADVIARLRQDGGCVSFDDVPHRPHSRVSDAWRELRRLLAAQGFRAVLRHQLRWPSLWRRSPELAVVKLAVPGLEMLEHHNRRIGPRLLQSLVQRG